MVKRGEEEMWGEGGVGAGFAPTPPQAGLSPARFASCGCSFGCSRERLRPVDEWIRGLGAGFGVSPSFVGSLYA